MQKCNTFNLKYLWTFLSFSLIVGAGIFAGLVLYKPGFSANMPAIHNTIGMEFVLIPAGQFMMGSPRNEPGRGLDERLHRVTLTRPFYIQTTEVTQEQWQTVMGYNPSGFKTCGNNCPVETVSWSEIQDFINRLNQLEGSQAYRLPTEAEWEYACRAGTGMPFSTGTCIATDQANFNGKRTMPACPAGGYRDKTLPTRSFAPNPWGLYDMHGNVWEWCQDTYRGKYPKENVTDPLGPSSGIIKVLRGGSWYSRQHLVRAACRRKDVADYRSHAIGFRLVKSP
jgi:formylglycine-generating enzyme required for sulfatase activity